MPVLASALVSTMLAVASIAELGALRVDPGGSAGPTNELLLPTNYNSSSPSSPPPPPPSNSSSSLLLPPSQPRPSAPYSSPYSPSSTWVFPSGLPPPLPPPIDVCGNGPPCGTCEVCQAYADADETGAPPQLMCTETSCALFSDVCGCSPTVIRWSLPTKHVPW